ncbi:hypothetical protein ACS0TY_023939 [Phlomoides rotata]
MASSDLIRDLFGEDSDDEVNTQVNETQTNSSSVPTENNDEEDTSVIEPGMVFNSVDSLFDAYQEHARVRGFSVVKRTLAKRNEREPKYALIVYDKAGTSKANKSSKKIDCKARLNAKKLDDESWIGTKMVNEHNHEIDPSFSPLMAGHRQLHIHICRQLEANDITGIRSCKNIQLLEVQSGGPKNLGCLPKDCRNFIEERRRLRLGDGDAEAIRKMFATLQMKDRNFFHLMDIDEDGRLRNVLWIHPISKAAYEDFHDVVSFDTTYLVNRKDVYRRHSSIFFARGYPHKTEEYKNFQEVEKYFQQCVDAAMGSIEKMEYIKEMCIDMKNELINWNSGSTTTNVYPSVRISKSLGGTPVLDPNVAVPRGIPRTTRFMSALEARGHGRGGRGGKRTSDATRTSGRGGRGGRRASGATRGTRGCNSRGRCRVASMPTHGDNNNDNEFLFDLNEDLNASQASFVF